MTIKHYDQTLQLHHLKAIYWEEQKTLLLADLHLGKAAHFRKAGIAAPAKILEDNFSNFEELLRFFKPVRVLFLGDLFHSRLNKVWEQFNLLLLNYAEISFELVKGNHDILPEAVYESSVLKIHQPPLIVAPFILTHYPLKENNTAYYNFYGHLHPGVLLEGFGGQSMKLPCFHFGKSKAVLPAFGAFTGLAMQSCKSEDRVFVIVDERVLEINC